MNTLYDQFHRPHHEQLFRNFSSAGADDVIDSIEIVFKETIAEFDKEKIRVVCEDFSGGKIEYIGWPHGNMVTLWVVADAYNRCGLRDLLEGAGFTVEAIRYFYTARLGKLA